MAIPDYQTIMLPLLRHLADGKEHSIGDTVEALAAEFRFSSEERQQLLASGQTVIRNRTGWAQTYLRKAGLIEFPARGRFRITERGRSVLARRPERIDVKFLEEFPEFVAFRELRHEKEEEARMPGMPIPSGLRTPTPARLGTPIPTEVDATPEEALEAAYTRLRVDLEVELLDQVKEASPGFFERLVVELLVKMGYGGTRRDAGRAIGKSGDGGIDGIINEDRLGLDVIYVQAKRWDATVGRPEIQKFAGALQGHRARKGVFITTSEFSRDAVDYVSRIDSKVVLIDGAALARYMIDHDVGVSPSRSYEVKKIDSDYFAEE